jgi:hypothetical protein
VENERLAELKKQKDHREHIQRYLATGKNLKFQYQKKFAVEQASNVIKIIEKMALSDPNIKTNNVMKKVLKNLIERNKDKGRDNEYWSM